MGSILVSSSIWVFLFSSIIFCVAFLNEYASSPERTVLTVAGLSFLPVVILGPVAFFLLRNRALRQIYPYFANNSNLAKGTTVSDRASSIFSEVLAASKLRDINLSLVENSLYFPASAAVDWNKEKTVAVSTDTIEALDDEELKAVLAHELGHISNKDSLQKTVATAYRAAFLFDPLARLIEAAVYRNAEYGADEYSAKLTGMPAALASALLKLFEFNGSSSISAKTRSVPILSPLMRTGQQKESGLLSKEPSITSRIQKLLELDDKMATTSRPRQSS